MSVITKQIEVDVPTHVAYQQWTQFEEFPRFMEGVEQVEQLDATRTRWHVSIGGFDRSFEALTETQEPDHRISWRATEGEDQAGTVTFEELDSQRTRVNLEMTYDSDRWTDKIADFLNIVDRRVEKDLERFKEFMEEGGSSADAPNGGDGRQVIDGEAARQQPSHLDGPSGTTSDLSDPLRPTDPLDPLGGPDSPGTGDGGDEIRRH
ncbi:MAG: SRPBCC family protein [Nitriliruptoraceae bacterium]|nr:SRPBCC family protein [Nitriliruptoraceae bacterium]